VTLERDIHDEWQFAKSHARQKVRFSPKLMIQGIDGLVKRALLDAASSEWLAGTLRTSSGLPSLCAYFPTGNEPGRHRPRRSIERHSPCCRRSAFLFGTWRMRFSAITEWLEPDRSCNCRLLADCVEKVFGCAM